MLVSAENYPFLIIACHKKRNLVHKLPVFPEMYSLFFIFFLPYIPILVVHIFFYVIFLSAVTVVI